jgi:hypothetical protein
MKKSQAIRKQLHNCDCGSQSLTVDVKSTGETMIICDKCGKKKKKDTSVAAVAAWNKENNKVKK